MAGVLSSILLSNKVLEKDIKKEEKKLQKYNNPNSETYKGNVELLAKLETEYTELMTKYNIKRCYYGHLHANSIQDAIEGNAEGIEYKLVSSDGLDFKLLKI